MRRIYFIACLLLVVILAACTPDSEEEATPLIIPTTVFPSIENLEPTSAALQPSVAETPEDSANTQVPAEPATPEPPQVSEIADLGYQVAFVADDDVLNVRADAGAEHDIVAELAPDEAGVDIVGPGRLVDGSTWVPISAGSSQGWVNSRFLSRVIDSEGFCQDETVLAILEDLEQAIADENGQMLSQLVHPERGLRLHQSWWNPAVFLQGDDLASLFTSGTEYDWGHEDGSGNAIIGPFSTTLLPLLQQDLLSAPESACNEILHGGSAGFIRVPDGYQAIDFYSYFRPGTEQNAELDWGGWVVGVEQWQGKYYLSFLVHLAWEI